MTSFYPLQGLLARIVGLARWVLTCCVALLPSAEAAAQFFWGGVGGAAFNNVDDFSIRRTNRSGTVVTRYKISGAVGHDVGVFGVVSRGWGGLQMSAEHIRGGTYAPKDDTQGEVGRQLSRTPADYVVVRLQPYLSLGNRKTAPFPVPYIFGGVDGRFLLNEASINDSTGVERDLKQFIFTVTGGGGLQIGPLAFELSGAIPFEPVHVRDNVRLSQAPRGTQFSLVAKLAFGR